jgi:hypothetical protein
MKINKIAENTDFIKFAAESYMGQGGDPIVLFTEATEWLYDCYEKTGDKICLQAAVQLIKTYMELGLIYQRADNLFEKILQAAGTRGEERFPRSLVGKSLGRSKEQIREVLGYWPKSGVQENNASWVISDIQKRLEKQELGCYYYGRKSGQTDFELLILKENSYLLDIARKKVYQFTEVKRKDGEA